MKNIKYLVEKFMLEPHIEGGYLRRDYCSPLIVPDSLVGRSGKGKRLLATSCYYLLTYKDRCIFHKLRSEEIWFFLQGDPLEFYEICEQSRTLSKTILGPNVYKGHKLKHHVKAGTWFGALPQVGSIYCLLSCVVLPGFEFEDWEKGNSSYLLEICPQAEESIRLLT